jgi:hypothetical protein
MFNLATKWRLVSFISRPLYTRRNIPLQLSGRKVSGPRSLFKHFINKKNPFLCWNQQTAPRLSSPQPSHVTVPNPPGPKNRNWQWKVFSLSPALFCVQFSSNNCHKRNWFFPVLIFLSFQSVLNSTVLDFHCAQELIFYTKSFGIIVSTSVLSA